MKRSQRAAIVAGFLIGAACLPAQAAGTFRAEIVKVEDGDTVTVRDANGHRRIIRLAAIDAPEHDQPSGNTARDAMVTYALGRAATVSWHTRDQYGRYVGVVRVAPLSARCAARTDCPHTLDLGMLQLTLGLAWWYRAFAAEQTPQARARYALAEREARQGRIGLWRDRDPLPPWLWRRMHPR